MAIPTNLVAEALGTGVTPKVRMNLQRLLADQGDAPPVSMIGADQLLGDSSAPAAPSLDQTLAATGGMMPGGEPANGGMGRIGWAPKPAGPTQQRMKAFEETAGGKMVSEALEKRKKLSWWMPDFMADRNERMVSQGIELAKAEMGGSEAQDVSNQRWANVLGETKDREARVTHTEAQLSALEEERRARDKYNADRLALEGKQLEETTRYHNLLDTDRDATQSYRERVRGATKGATVPGKNPLYDVHAADPGATGVFANYAANLLKKDSSLEPEDIPAEQVKASRLGILPPMMSTPADRPQGLAAPQTSAPSGGTFKRDPRTGKLVRLR